MMPVCEPEIGEEELGNNKGDNYGHGKVHTCVSTIFRSS